MTDLSIPRGRHVRALPYMNENWYSVLRAEVEMTSMTAAAKKLGVSRGLVSQIIHGSGLYGSGVASTKAVADRVTKTFVVQLQCPFLSAHQAEPRYISGADCRAFAYRPAPTSSPVDVSHWRACSTCPSRVSPPNNWEDT